MRGNEGWEVVLSGEKVRTLHSRPKKIETPELSTIRETDLVMVLKLIW